MGSWTVRQSGFPLPGFKLWGMIEGPQKVVDDSGELWAADMLVFKTSTRCKRNRRIFAIQELFVWSLTPENLRGHNDATA